MVLTVKQFELLMEQPKQHINKIRMEFLLHTGMRYSEAERFVFKDYNFKAMKIHKPKTGRTYKQCERWIKLIPHYNLKLHNTKELLQLKDKDGLGFPSLSGFQKNLELWFKKAEINKCGNLVKEFRKTRECWLIAAGYDSVRVALDQGHTNLTQLKHYLNNKFSSEDVDDIKEYCKGWV